MSEHMPQDVSPAGRDLREYTDELRAGHDIVRNVAGEWVLLRHADVVAAALDHETYSSAVSRFLQVPNGLDGQEHTEFREVIDRYLTEEALTPFLPVFEDVAAQLVSELPRGAMLDAVRDIGAVFAVRAQCAWLGWPVELEPRLLSWMEDNHAATRSGNPALMAAVAQEFDEIIRSVLLPRRGADVDAPDDVTTRLSRDTVDGRELSEAELVSILRNWTGGDLASIALCVGVIVAHLAEEPALIEWILTATDSETDAIIDEILRIDDPFVSNRRITTCPVSVAGQDIPANARVKLHWTSANRDERVFDTDRFDPEGHAGQNLVYGIGKHVCPGRLLSTWELRSAVRALASSVGSIEFAHSHDALERAVAPVGGFHRVPIILT
ncbi:MAG: cytochrome P450 [Arachnia sp.]